MTRTDGQRTVEPLPGGNVAFEPFAVSGPLPDSERERCQNADCENGEGEFQMIGQVETLQNAGGIEPATAIALEIA
ncbi:MAG: hypothetical protein R3D02_15095 [Hyphomicrobiales bacterium]